MGRFDRASKLWSSSALLRLRARKPLCVLAAVAGLLTLWALGGARHAPVPREDDRMALAPLPAEHRQEPESVKAVQHDTCCEGACDCPDCEDCCPAASNAALASVPCERHKRSDYPIEPPDVLSIVVQADSADESILTALNGQRLVEADGTLNLGEPFGAVQVAGVTLADVPARIQACLDAQLPDAQVTVEVSQQNSKVCYVICDDGDKGCDCVIRLPVSADETVCDALAHLPQVDFAEKDVWIARPCAGGDDDEILPVNAVEVTSGEDTSTNYSLKPGDRVFVATRRTFWESLSDIMSDTWDTLVEMFW